LGFEAIDLINRVLSIWPVRTNRAAPGPSRFAQPPGPRRPLLAITARQYPGPNAQHHKTPRIIQSVPPVESASSSEVIVAR